MIAPDLLSERRRDLSTLRERGEQGSGGRGIVVLDQQC
jgi:hypothetical protein